MKINKFLIIPVLILILILASGQLLSAQNTEIPQVDNSIWSSIETSDWILILFAFVLLLIIFILEIFQSGSQAVPHFTDLKITDKILL